jgi:hypothetical protein
LRKPWATLPEPQLYPGNYTRPYPAVTNQPSPGSPEPCFRPKQKILRKQNRRISLKNHQKGWSKMAKIDHFLAEFGQFWSIFDTFWSILDCFLHPIKTFCPLPTNPPPKSTLSLSLLQLSGSLRIFPGLPTAKVPY